MNKYKTYFIDSNFASLRYISLVCLVFAFYFFLTDFYLANLIKPNLLKVYKSLDFFFLFLTIISFLYSWTSFVKKTRHKEIFNVAIPFLYLNWAATITGIDFEIFGLSTFLIFFLFCAFFLYLNLPQSLLLFFSSVATLFITISITGRNNHFMPMIMLLIPTAIFCMLMTSRNYRNKIKELEQQEQIVAINSSLVTANETLEEEVKLRTSQIQSALDKATESDRLKTAFLENMSHEIHTPLNVLEGFSKLITRPGLEPEKLKKYSDLIKQSSEKIIQIINDIILISEIHSKQVKIYNSKFDIIYLLHDIVKHFESIALKKGLNIILQNGAALDQYLITNDEKKLRTILSHLIDNAIKFSNKGEIKVQFEKHEEWFHISITDEGIGIPAEMHESIFHPFRQQENDMNKNPGGNGLGLSIVKSCTELLGGKVEFKSTVEVGSTFKVSFPVMRG